MGLFCQVHNAHAPFSEHAHQFITPDLRARLINTAVHEGIGPECLVLLMACLIQAHGKELVELVRVSAEYRGWFFMCVARVHLSVISVPHGFVRVYGPPCLPYYPDSWPRSCASGWNKLNISLSSPSTSPSERTVSLRTRRSTALKRLLTVTSILDAMDSLAMPYV